ncbi:hypothetical protein E5288_WYG002312 [Bos mutus]|uniref:Uncharacterized protein n=1 Tax=Bos mutus TaxID=72004 RepID=A0A6B0R302_9CETA|nr:hypothetical protein [Bos mutus]
MVLSPTCAQSSLYTAPHQKGYAEKEGLARGFLTDWLQEYDDEGDRYGPHARYHVDKPSLISQLEQEDKVVTEEGGILPGTRPDLETVLKAKWLTPKKPIFRKEHSNDVRAKMKFQVPSTMGKPSGFFQFLRDMRIDSGENKPLNGISIGKPVSHIP